MTTSSLLLDLRSAVEQSKIDRSRLAASAGISRKTLYDFLEGNKDPRWSTIEAIAQVLKQDIHMAPSALGGSAHVHTYRAATSPVTRLLADNAVEI